MGINERHFGECRAAIAFFYDGRADPTLHKLDVLLSQPLSPFLKVEGICDRRVL